MLYMGEPCGFLLTKLNVGTLLVLSLVCMHLNYNNAAAEAGNQACPTSSGYGLCNVVDNCRRDYPQCGVDCGRGWSLYNAVSVEWYGAIGDGLTDDTQAFADAWKEACALDFAVFLIPEGRTYLVSPLDFKGPCGSSLIVELAGTLIAPSEPHTWNKSNSNAWLHFSHMNDLTVEGGGTIDGQGQQWWAQSCKTKKTNKCHDAPTALRFTAVHNLKVRNLQTVNSPQIHIKLANCYGVQVVNLLVDAPADSPNTDGIHISATQNVLIQDSWIGTGDDCVSIVSGSFDIQIKNIECGPGHGISIGSLGKGGSDDQVSLVAIDGAILTGTSNGIRIKTWQGGTGSAISFRFQNVQMNNVSYPIIIDQRYCDSPSSCPVNETSAVHVSKVCYKNIWGTSATEQAIKLECSELVPCKNLFFEDINLVPVAGAGNSTSLCRNAEGVVVGTVIPSVDCLQLSPDTPEALHFTM